MGKKEENSRYDQSIIKANTIVRKRNWPLRKESNSYSLYFPRFINRYGITTKHYNKRHYIQAKYFLTKTIVLCFS